MAKKKNPRSRKNVRTRTKTGKAGRVSGRAKRFKRFKRSKSTSKFSGGRKMPTDVKPKFKVSINKPYKPKRALIDVRETTFVPPVADAVFLFRDGMDITTGTAGQLLNDYTIIPFLPDPRDPYFKSGGRAAYGWAQMIKYYNSYTVRRCEFEFSFYNHFDSTHFEVFVQKTRRLSQVSATSPYGCYIGEACSGSTTGQYARDFSNAGKWHKHAICPPASSKRIKMVWKQGDTRGLGETNTEETSYLLSTANGWSGSGPKALEVMPMFYVGFRNMSISSPGALTGYPLSWQVNMKIYVQFSDPKVSTATVMENWPLWDGAIILDGSDLDNAAYVRDIPEAGEYSSFQTNTVDDYNP
nr:capsid protein [Cressdnaviricota sp.]